MEDGTKRARRVGEETADKSSDSAVSPWLHITGLMERAEINVGESSPLGCVAVASGVRLYASRPGPNPP
jgi:hypothetical protein